MISSVSLLDRDSSDPPFLQPDDARSKRLAVLLFEVARSLDHDLATALPRLERDPKLAALRSLILEEDRAAIAKLQQKFDDPRQFAEAISSVLADAFTIAGARDEQLAKALAPILERAIQASIRKNPGTLVGILYPLMGSVVRKSIAESLDGTLQRMNQAFKHSFSWQGLKWRLEALRSGSSFADVVLKHTVHFRVEHVFLIHRKTGLLIEHVAAPEVTAQDPQLVSGMLSAIQDFVRDSFEGTNKTGGSGIDTLRLGDLLLWCEEGPFAFLAAVIRGNPPESLHAALRETLTNIHDQFRSPLEEFQGDSATLGDLVTPLQRELQQQERPREKQLSPWLWILPLVLFLLVGGWVIQRTIVRLRVDTYVQRLREEPGIVVANAELRNGRWQISGLRDPLAADPAVLLSQSRLDPNRVAFHWESYQALNPAIVLRRLAASLNPPPSVSLSLKGDTVQVTGSVPQYWVERARTLVAALPAGSPKVDLSALRDVQDPEFIRLRDAIQGHIIAFDSNADRPARGEDATLDAVADEFRQLMRVTRRLGFSARMMISGHADAVGNETANLSLSAARAEVVRSMLKARGIAPELLTVRSAGPLEPLLAPNGKATAAMNRRVTFTVIASE
ncbi:MAG TPA: OmpA family protein [Acidobacteriaceae bacterium]|nr:OmpA family protein [Acidobacteriaceae bacterium]